MKQYEYLVLNPKIAKIFANKFIKIIAKKINEEEFEKLKNGLSDRHYNNLISCVGLSYDKIVESAKKFNRKIFYILFIALTIFMYFKHDLFYNFSLISIGIFISIILGLTFIQKFIIHMYSVYIASKFCVKMFTKHLVFLTMLFSEIPFNILNKNGKIYLNFELYINDEQFKNKIYNSTKQMHNLIQSYMFIAEKENVCFEIPSEDDTVLNRKLTINDDGFVVEYFKLNGEKYTIENSNN